MGRLVTEYYRIASKKLPGEFDGVKIAYLSDLHNVSFGKGNERLLKQIEKEAPDYVFLGGDMIVGSREFEPEIVLNLCEGLSKNYPVYMAFGNHEQKLMAFEETKDIAFPAYIRELKQLGICILDNESVGIRRGAGEIRLYGLTVDYKYFGKWWKRVTMRPDYVTELLGTCPEDAFSVLLAHSPKYFKAYAGWGASLVLSGHVHGGIIRLPWLGGVIAPDLALFPKYDAGYFKEPKSQLILSRGLGSHTINLRIGNPPELSMIVLKKSTCENPGK